MDQGALPPFPSYMTASEGPEIVQQRSLLSLVLAFKECSPELVLPIFCRVANSHESCTHDFSCPFLFIRRHPQIENRHESALHPSPPAMLSPPASRRDSLLSRHSSVFPSSPVTTNMYGSQYQGSQWLSSGQAIHNPGASNGMMSPSSLSNVSQTGLPLNFTSSSLQNGSVGSHRSYSSSYDTPHSYPQHHQY